jgi:hypothetical protein
MSKNDTNFENEILSQKNLLKNSFKTNRKFFFWQGVPTFILISYNFKSSLK